MNPELEQFDRAVAQLTAEGQPFALEKVVIDGVEYRNYAAMPPNLGAYFLVMERYREREFAVYRDERYTFGEAYALSAAFANALVEQFGVRKGDRVAILSRNNPQWMMAYIAILSIGAVAVPMNAWWTTEELDYGFADSGARVVVADRAEAEALSFPGSPTIRIDGEDLAELCHPVSLQTPEPWFWSRRPSVPTASLPRVVPRGLFAHELATAVTCQLSQGTVLQEDGPTR